MNGEIEKPLFRGMRKGEGKGGGKGKGNREGKWEKGEDAEEERQILIHLFINSSIH